MKKVSYSFIIRIHLAIYNFFLFSKFAKEHRYDSIIDMQDFDQCMLFRNLIMKNTPKIFMIIFGIFL